VCIAVVVGEGLFTPVLLIMLPMILMTLLTATTQGQATTHQLQQATAARSMVGTSFPMVVQSLYEYN